MGWEVLMNQRTNHRAANNLGEVPATQEGENHSNTWGDCLEGKQRKKEAEGVALVLSRAEPEED